MCFEFVVIFDEFIHMWVMPSVSGGAVGYACECNDYRFDDGYLSWQYISRVINYETTLNAVDSCAF